MPCHAIRYVCLIKYSIIQPSVGNAQACLIFFIFRSQLFRDPPPRQPIYPLVHPLCARQKHLRRRWYGCKLGGNDSPGFDLYSFAQAHRFPVVCHAVFDCQKPVPHSVGEGYARNPPYIRLEKAVAGWYDGTIPYRNLGLVFSAWKEIKISFNYQYHAENL